MRKFEYYSRTKRPKLEYPVYQKEYVDYTIHQEKKSTGPGVDDFEIIDVVEEHKTNIDEFINSYNDKAGIEAVLRIVTSTGDLSLLNQIEPQYADLTIIPEDPEQALKLANGGAAEAFAALDPELVDGMDMEEFIKTLTPEKLKAFIDKKVAEKQKKEVKDESSK